MDTQELDGPTVEIQLDPAYHVLRGGHVHAPWKVAHDIDAEFVGSVLRRALGTPGHGEVFCALVLVEFPGTGDRVQADDLLRFQRAAGSGWATSGWA